MSRCIFFVLGMPGSGKGTACSTISQKFNFQHLSAGDLLRAEQKRHDSKHSVLIKEYIASGRIVPPEITVALLRQAIDSNQEAKGFLIDGFPRELPQFTCFAEQFDTKNVYLIEVKCSQEECWRRISTRNEGRSDDNEATFKVRVNNFQQETLKVISMFREFGKLITVDGELGKEDVAVEAEEVLGSFLKEKQLI